MDVENFILELVDGLDVVDHLPHKVRGIIVDAQIVGGQNFEHLAPVGGGGHQVLSAGPLIGAEEHGAVLDADFHTVFFGFRNDRRPYFLDQLQIFFYGLGLIPADEGGDQIHAQLVGGADDLFQVFHVGGALFQISVHGVGVESQRGNLHALLSAVSQNFSGLFVGQLVHVDVAHARVTALRLAAGPAGHLYAGEAHLRRGVDHFFKIPSVQNRTDKSKFHRKKPPYI